MKFILEKLTRLVAVVLAVSAVTFLMLNLLPGDVAYVIGGADASPEDIQAILVATVGHRLHSTSDTGVDEGTQLAQHLLESVAIP